MTRTSILLDLLTRAPGLPPGAAAAAEEWWRAAKSDGEELVTFLIRQKVLSEAAPIVLDLVVEGTIAAAPPRLLTGQAAAILAQKTIAKPISTADELRGLLDLPPSSTTTPPPTEFLNAANRENIETVFLSDYEIPIPDGLLPDFAPSPPSTLLPDTVGDLPFPGVTPGPRSPMPRRPAQTTTPILLVPDAITPNPVIGNDSLGSSPSIDAGGPVSDSDLLDPTGDPAGLPAIGTALGRCLLLEQVGEGATGVVFRALHRMLNIPVAVKVYHRAIQASAAAAFTQLRRHVQLLAQLNHANVVRIWDIADDASFPYLVMEFVEGLSLADLLAHSGRLQPDRAVAVIEQAAIGLKAIAALGVVHRDVKPGNLLLTRVGDAKVADLGLALRPRDGIAALVGPAGAIAYMSPEQATGAKPLDHRSDIYSLGVTFYEALTGRPPFTGKKSAELLQRHLKELPRPPHELVSGLDPVLSEVVLTMLAKDPAQRYQTYDDLIEVLREVAGRVRSARTTDATTTPEPEKGRSSMWGALRSSFGFGRSDS